MTPDYHNEYKTLDDQWEQRNLRWYQSFTMHPWRWVLGATAGLVAVVVVLGLIGNWWGAERAKLTVGNRVTQSVYSTGNALHNISYFHSQCNTILSDNQQVTNDYQALQADEQAASRATDPIAQEQAGQTVAQDRVTWLGTKNQLSNDVRDYDARSADQTAAPFKAAGLPSRIDIQPATGELSGTVNCR